MTSTSINGVEVELHTYDANGNRTYYKPEWSSWPVLADYDIQDRLKQQDGVAYQYNADGQLTQRGTDTFQYSTLGELLQATVPNLSATPVTYAYDGMNRRIAKTDNTGTYQYLYGNLKNPFQLTAMRDPAGTLSMFYYSEAGALFAMNKGGTRYYVASDQVGTPKAVIDSTGTVVKLMAYDRFGQITFDSNDAVQMPVGFAGGITDDITGLVRFGYRDYEPQTGRWTAKDPIFFGGGQGNLYQYVQNNPVNWIDPTGLATQGLQLEGMLFAGLGAKGTLSLNKDSNGTKGIQVCVNLGVGLGGGGKVAGTLETGNMTKGHTFSTGIEGSVTAVAGVGFTGTVGAKANKTKGCTLENEASAQGAIGLGAEAGFSATGKYCYTLAW